MANLEVFTTPFKSEDYFAREQLRLVGLAHVYAQYRIAICILSCAIIDNEQTSDYFYGLFNNDDRQSIFIGIYCRNDITLRIYHKACGIDGAIKGLKKMHTMGCRDFDTYVSLLYSAVIHEKYDFIFELLK